MRRFPSRPGGSWEERRGDGRRTERRMHGSGIDSSIRNLAVDAEIALPLSRHTLEKRGTATSRSAEDEHHLSGLCMTFESCKVDNLSARRILGNGNVAGAC